MNGLLHKDNESTKRRNASLRMRKKRRRWLLVTIPALLAVLIWRLSIDPSGQESARLSTPSFAIPALDSTPMPSPAIPALDSTPMPSPASGQSESLAPIASISPSSAPSPTPSPSDEAPLPNGFVQVGDFVPEIRIDMRYSGSNNFMGRPVDGYEANTAILTQEAAKALARVQAELTLQELSLIVYDAYRPERAVTDFVRWGEDPEDQRMKESFYPDIPKGDILGKGFLARRSSHSRGSTVDVSIVRLPAGEPLDMGTPFDWFGPESDPDYRMLTAEQLDNRALLRSLMEREGFVISSIEWWHFRLKNEPYPKTCFDFPVR